MFIKNTPNNVDNKPTKRCGDLNRIISRIPPAKHRRDRCANAPIIILTPNDTRTGAYILPGPVLLKNIKDGLRMSKIIPPIANNSGIKNVPFDFIPVWLIENTFLAIAYISYLLPFQAMFYTPSAIYTGLIVGTNNILLHIGVQLFWILFFMQGFIPHH